MATTPPLLRTPFARLPDWESRLVALVNDRRLVPYQYGTTDCARFAQAAIEAVTGVTLLPGVAFPQSWIGLAKFMIARGWSTVEDVATEMLGPPVEVEEARRGDIVSFAECGEPHLAVRVGSEAVTPAAAGLVTVAPARWLNAWKVG